jgi:hypothetical protein
MIVDGVWIGNWICWTFTSRNYKKQYLFTDLRSLQFTVVRAKSSQFSTTDVPFPLRSRTVSVSQPQQFSANQLSISNPSTLTDYSLYNLYTNRTEKNRFRGLKPIYMEVCYWALLFMPLVILHHLLNVSVQFANKGGFTKKKYATIVASVTLLRFPSNCHCLRIRYLVTDCV